MRRMCNASIWRGMLLAAVIYLLTGLAQATEYNATLSYGAGGGSAPGSGTVHIDTDFNPVFAPAAGEVVTAGSSYTIKWKTTSDVGMSFDLCQMVSSTQFTRVFPQNQDGSYIGSNELNNGAYVWKVASSIPSGNNYVLLVDDGLVTAGISPVFSISNPIGSRPSSSTSTVRPASTSTLSSSRAPTLTSSASNPTASQPTEQGSTTTSTSASSLAASDSARSSSSPSPGVIGGAVGGALGGVILLLLAVILFLLRRKRSKNAVNVGPEDQPVKELDGSPFPRAEADAGAVKTAVQPVYATELPLEADKEFHELPTARDLVYGLPGSRLQNGSP